MFIYLKRVSNDTICKVSYDFPLFESFLVAFFLFSLELFPKENDS